MATYNEGHSTSESGNLDLELVDPQDVPVPREDVRLRGLTATPLGDLRRVRVDIRITPFLERPNLEIDLVSPGGETVARASVIEADHPILTITMHLRQEAEPGEYAIRSVLSYAADPPQDVREHRFAFEAGTGPTGDAS